MPSDPTSVTYNNVYGMCYFLARKQNMHEMVKFRRYGSLEFPLRRKLLRDMHSQIQLWRRPYETDGYPTMIGDPASSRDPTS